MKKILITTKNLNVGGVETSLIFLLNKLIKEDFEIDLLVFDKGVLQDKLDPKINVLYYDDYFKKINNKFYNLKKNILVKSLYNNYINVLEKKYDYSVAYYGFDNYIDMVAAAVNSKNKIIWVHNDFLNAIKNKKFSFLFNIMYKLMGRKFKYFDKIVCVSKYTKKNFEIMFKNEKKTTCIHNYIDDVYIKKCSKEKSNIIMDDSKFNIVAVGRLTRLKNFDKVVLMTSELIKANKNVHTYIIGEGEEYSNLEFLIKSLNLNKHVTLLGNQSNPYNIQKQANLLVSMSQYESFGNVLIESMILKVPYLSNINSGSLDIHQNLTPTNMGFICRNDNMLDKVIEIIDNKLEPDKFNVSKYNKDIDKDIKKLFS